MSTREIKSRDCHGKTSVQQEEYLFTSKLNLNLRKKVMKLVKYYIWSTALFGAET
jgi:hypothetical protein